MGQEFHMDSFLSSSNVKKLLHCLLVCIISTDKFSVIPKLAHQYITCFYSLSQSFCLYIQCSFLSVEYS